MKNNYYKVLETERLILRKAEYSDANDIFEYCSDLETTKYMLFDTHKSISDTYSFLDFLNSKYAKNETLDYVFVLKENNKVIGSGGVFDATTLPHFANIGYILHKNYWGQGFIVEAMSALIKHLFTECGLHRLEAKHFVENVNSGKVMRKLGMIYEGQSVEKIFCRGKYWTSDHYYLLNK